MTKESDWMRAFWPMTCKSNFPQIWGLLMKTENYLFSSFFPAKSNDKIFWRLNKKIIFKNFLPVLGQTWTLFKNLLLSLFPFSRSLLFLRKVCYDRHKNAWTSINSYDLTFQDPKIEKTIPSDFLTFSDKIMAWKGVLSPPFF